MIREAELFVMSEDVLVEVVGRVRGEQWDIVLPPLLDQPGTDRPAAMRLAVGEYARDDAWVPDLLAGRSPDEIGPDRFGGDLLGADPHTAVTKYAEQACAAARAVDDGGATVHAAGRDLGVRDYLTELTLTRAFLAHEIAMHLGSRACPLTEELARGLCAVTGPEAQRWRAAGFFREPVPLPADVSWRDRFLLTAGRDPHPLEDRH
jgi:hypothetical protein